MRQEEVDLVKDETFSAARSVALLHLASGDPPSTRVQMIEFPGLPDKVLLETVEEAPDPFRPVFTLEFLANHRGA